MPPGKKKNQNRPALSKENLQYLELGKLGVFIFCVNGDIHPFTLNP